MHWMKQNIRRYNPQRRKFSLKSLGKRMLEDVRLNRELHWDDCFHQDDSYIKVMHSYLVKLTLLSVIFYISWVLIWVISHQFMGIWLRYSITFKGPGPRCGKSMQLKQIFTTIVLVKTVISIILYLPIILKLFYFVN